MSKFCFVFLDSTNRMPYIEKYLNSTDFRYDIVLWDRSKLFDQCGADNCFRLIHNISNNRIKGKIDKIIGYARFAIFANRCIKKYNYDGLFVFTPQTGMLINCVLEKYKHRYILDIRDYWMESKKWFRRIEKELILNSFATCISSDAYKTFLPEYNYTLTHNVQNISSDIITYFRNRQFIPGKRIILACIGGIKNIEYDKSVLSYFANDERFEVRFIGRGYDQLLDYCTKHSIQNAVCEGTFPMSETIEKYRDVDMILNMYGNHDKHLDYALSNKLYFAAQLGIPIVVCPDTHMETVAMKNGFGISLDINKREDKDRLYRYYSSLNRSAFNMNCDLFLDTVSKDQENFTSLVQRFVNTCSSI